MKWMMERVYEIDDINEVDCAGVISHQFPKHSLQIILKKMLKWMFNFLMLMNLDVAKGNITKSMIT